MLALAALVSCDTYTTSVAPPPDGSVHVHVATVDIVYTAAQKDSMAAAAAAADAGSPSRMVPIGPVSNVIGAPSSAATSVTACGGGAGAFVGYSKSQVAFEPESSPSIVPFPLSDDGFIPDSDVPLGFSFNFEGQSYDRVNVYMNGFLLFGARPGTNGFPTAGSIPSTANPNNIIALGWSDWQPNMVADGIRWETRGEAPNRKFILQFNNVPEFSSANRIGAISPTVGRMMSQVVLSEGSNDITIYTNELSTTNSNHLITQGIENADGTVASYDSVLNVVLNMQLPRVRNFFKLQNDAVRFSFISTRDAENPTITAPENITVGNDPGLASAVVVVASPPASDNCVEVSVTGVRSDGKALDAPYPVGVTTITWTATDGAGNSASVSQTVTVLDIEAPVWDPTVGSVRQANATSPSGAVVTLDNLVVTDNVGVTSVSCEPASGSFFPIGTTEALCTASDAAGNSSSKSFLVFVINAHDQIGALIEHVEALSLADGTAEPIINQLLTAYDATADGSAACKKVSDFMSMVQKKNLNISSGDVAYMLAEGSRILSVMGCPPVLTAARPLIRGTP
ncbi:MAG TPA: HYR domain-containing protein [Gemmatimonadaceae bacterium]|nr:HYR domain-containing protein [Gemmatimonadaceae bacterium]